MRGRPAARECGSLVKGLLAQPAGVEPRLTVTGDDGPLYKLESAFFRDGPVEYLGFHKYRTGAAEPSQRQP